FRVMNVQVLRGRAFTATESTGNPPVAIVTAATAKRFWPNDDAVGKHVRLVGQDRWHTIIGVVADVRAYDLQRDEPQWIGGTVSAPYSANATLENGHVPIAMTRVAPTTRDATQVAGLLRNTVTSLSQEAAVSELRPMPVVLAQSVSTPR